MRSAKNNLILGCYLMALGFLLAGCQSDSPSSSASPETAATSAVEEPVRGTMVPLAETEEAVGQRVASEMPEIETVMAKAENGLPINEEVRRTPLFRINTLAYELPGMDEVEVVNITYAFYGDRPLTMDIYYPPGTAADDQLPAVVFGIGYRMSREPLRNEHFFTSWGRLVAAAGMVGITYDAEQPDQDLEVLMAFIQENAAALRIDPGQIGFHSTSANQPTVMSYLMQEGRTGIQFAVYYYGYTLTPDRKFSKEYGEDCARRGCLLNELADVTHVDPDIPLLMVKAGQDFVPKASESIDYFVDYVRREGGTVTVIEYEEGVHGFDTQQKTAESAEIIAKTVAFMKENFGLSAQTDSGLLVLHNGTVVTGTGEEPIPNSAVVIENGLITAVGPEAEVTFPEGAIAIDVEGRTILPGLIDARASDLLNQLEIAEGQLTNVALEVFLRNALKGGVTTVRATGWQWEKQQDVAGLRSALAAQGNTVPRIIVAGTTLAHKNGSAVDTYSHSTVGVTTVDESRQTSERLIELGVDQIGFILSVTQEAHLGTHEGLPPTLSLPQLEAIVEVAHSQGKRVAGQAVFPSEAEMALAAGVDELLTWPSRALPIPDDLIQALVARSVPVVSGFNITPPQEGDVRRFLDAGGMLVFGTYAPNSGPLGEPYREFQVMAINGMTPMEMIESATANAAYAVGLRDAVGTLEVGKQADIIVVDGDPFEDFRVMREVVYVIKGGDLVVQPG